ncbi:hypothetical protein, partial [Pseudomonas sp. CCC4.4]|uniref:hypothetical protein n=1 Tax=Pseudomonas sp. CCC4.4 TaxID=3048612 RepID=UPI002B226FBE
WHFVWFEVQGVRTEAFPNKFGPTVWRCTDSVGAAEGCDRSEGPSPTRWLQMAACPQIVCNRAIKPLPCSAEAALSVQPDISVHEQRNQNDDRDRYTEKEQK